MREICLIVAASNNNVIGRVKNGVGEMLWHLPDDLRHFQEKTLFHDVIMGRITYESIPAEYLPPDQRNVIVLSSNTNSRFEGVQTASNLAEALEKTETNRVFIAGGARTYRQAMPMAHRIYLTRVHTTVKRKTGDKKFPAKLPDHFYEVGRTEHKKDDRHEFDFSIIEYELLPY